MNSSTGSSRDSSASLIACRSHNQVFGGTLPLTHPHFVYTCKQCKHVCHVLHIAEKYFSRKTSLPISRLQDAKQRQPGLLLASACLQYPRVGGMVLHHRGSSDSIRARKYNYHLLAMFLKGPESRGKKF